MDYSKLQIFINRLSKIGVNIKLQGNYPWIYLHQINGKTVTERFYASHGFTIAFLPLRGDELQFTDIKKIFEIIRKYR